MAWSLWVLSFAIASWPAGLLATTAEPLIFLGDRNLPPYEFLEDGAPKGANVDLAQAIGRVLGRPVEVRLMDWAEAQERLRAGEGHALTMLGQTDERDPLYDFSQPTLPVTLALFVRADERAGFDPDDLEGRHIGVTRGGLPRTFFESNRPEVSLVLVEDFIDGTKRLLRGEIDALAANAWSERFLLHEMNVAGVAELPPLVQRTGNIAVRGGEAALLADIDAALMEVKANGDFERIIDRWSHTRMKLVPEAAVQTATITAGAAALALVLLILALVWLQRGKRALAREVAERRRAQDALRSAHEQAEAARREAEAASQSKSRFLAAASHDLRQPIQSMLLLSATLERHVATDGGREILLHLQRATDGLKELLDRLLDLSRLDAGGVVSEVREFPIAELLEQMDAMYGAIAAGKGLGWKTERCHASVRSDPMLLGQILQNFVENAVRYTDRGSVRITCRIGDGVLRIAVQDTGCGIPPDHLERIWEEFHQVGNAARDRAEGLGLGLAIVRRLTELLGHGVEVRSKPGEGSTFSIEVPLGAEAEPNVSEADVALAHAPDQLALVIEDDALVLLGLQTGLRDLGYDVLIAASGAQASERLAETDRAPDVIISDYRLRDGEVGTDVIRQVRERLGTVIPAILLTGETGLEAQREATAYGIEIVHKPVTARQLSAAVQTCMEVLRAAPTAGEAS